MTNNMFHPRRATNRELSQWLAQGNGEVGEIFLDEVKLAKNYFSYNPLHGDREVSEFFIVRRWDDENWHQPTVNYMGIKEGGECSK